MVTEKFRLWATPVVTALDRFRIMAWIERLHSCTCPRFFLTRRKGAAYICKACHNQQPMQVVIRDDASELGRAAGAYAAQLMREAIAAKGQANIVLATGTSQLETLKQLVKEQGIDWGRVVMFHLDEYIGLPESSPASFRKYLKERFLDKVPPLQACHLIDGESDPAQECRRLSDLIVSYPADLALVGIGENGHLAFNDPPADFDATAPYLVVTLDERCRRQQLGEGWFGSLDEVPRQAITMSVDRIMQAGHIVGSVPDARKAAAVRDCFQGPVSPLVPASILRQHPSCRCFLDLSSAALLTGGMRQAREGAV